MLNYLLLKLRRDIQDICLSFRKRTMFNIILILMFLLVKVNNVLLTP
jgi:hypothetical protein